MNEDELKGKAERFTGRAKEAAGVMTGDKETRAEGLGRQIKGYIREKLGAARSKLEEMKREADARKRERQSHA